MANSLTESFLLSINHKIYRMKQLLVVMTLFTCVHVSSAFSDAKNYNAATTANNHRSPNVSLKNNVWVNPWANVKRLSTNTCVTVVDGVSGRVPTKCSIDFYGVPIPISTQRVMWHAIPPGTMVTLRFEIAENPSLGQGFYVLD